MICRGEYAWRACHRRAFSTVRLLEIDEIETQWYPNCRPYGPVSVGWALYPWLEVRAKSTAFEFIFALKALRGLLFFRRLILTW